MKSRLIVATLLVLVTGTAAASDWQPVGSNGKASFAMDIDSIVREGDIVRAWVRAVFAEPMDGPNGIKVLSARSRQYFNCAERRWAHKQSTFYADQQFEKVLRDVEEEHDALLDWNEVPPDTLTEDLLEFAYSHSPPK